jgi:hypothetical protein
MENGVSQLNKRCCGLICGRFEQEKGPCQPGCKALKLDFEAIGGGFWSLRTATMQTPPL